MQYYARCDWPVPVIYYSTDARMTSLRGVTRPRYQSSVSLASKDFENSGQNKTKNVQL